MVDRGLVPFVHVVHESVDESLWKLGALARSFPDTTFVALDGFGAFDGAKQCFYVADLHPNVVFDTALAFQWDVVEQFVRQFGAERVMFGSDAYSYRRLPTVLDRLVASDLDRASVQAICAGNVRRILGIGPV
jgi:uncharacterized protein